MQCIANWAIEAVGGACTMDNVAPFSCLLLVSSSKASCNCLEMGGREVTMLLLFFFFLAKFCGSSLKFRPQFGVKCIIVSCVFIFGAAHYEKNRL